MKTMKDIALGILKAKPNIIGPTPQTQAEWETQLEDYGDLHSNGCGTNMEEECNCDMQGLKPLIRKAINSTRAEAVRETEKSTAWCECGDALETIEIKRTLEHPVNFGNGPVSEVIDHYEYFCFGCSKTYVLKEVTPQKSPEETGGGE